jgi:hypothetical protein
MLSVVMLNVVMVSGVVPKKELTQIAAFSKLFLRGDKLG